MTSLLYYFIALFIVFLIVGMFLFFRNKRKIAQKKLLEQIWGKKINRYRNFKTIVQYKLNDNETNCYSLTNQTLADIDIEALFSFIDRAETTIGQQYLYSKLVKPSVSIDELKMRGSYSDYFAKNKTIRIRTQAILHEFEKKKTNLISDFFDPELKVSTYKYYKSLKLLSILAFLTLFIFLIYPQIVFLIIFLFGTNLLIHLIFRHNNYNKLIAIRQVYQLLKTVDRLKNLNLPVNSEKVSEAAKKIKKFRKTYHFLDFGIPLNDISSIIFYLLDLIRSFFLIEVHLLNFSYNEIIKNKDAVKEFFIYIGKVEMALSIASLKSATDLNSCVPSISEECKILLCENMIHPLVKDCTPNSLKLNNTNAFITGSNMSGKSTFLRTLLINSILTQSLFICFADSFKSSIVKSFSSIKISDNLQEGTSFYFEEVNIIHEMVLNCNSGIKNLFVIDEIFKGTNTVERIALSKAILQNLSSAENIIIASSHDIELIELLNNEFELYHFTERITDNNLHFDHKIKSGPLRTRNAIKIIELEGFPIEIVKDAKSVAQDLKDRSTLLNPDK